MFNLKCLLYYTLFVIFEIYKINIIFHYDKIHKDILGKNKLFHSFCFFLGYLLNISPALNSQRNSKTKENFIINESKGEKTQSIRYIYNKSLVKFLSTKDIIKFFILCFIVLLTDFIENISYLINKHQNNGTRNTEYEQNFIFIEFIVIFLLSKFSKEVFYKHQNISFLILILVEIIKTIVILSEKNLYGPENIFIIFISIIYSILYAIY